MFVLATSACESASFLVTLLFIKKLVKILSYIVPAVLILLVSIDMAKAVIASNDDEIKRTQKLAIKRIIAALVIFFIPIIVDVSFNMLGDAGGTWKVCYDNASDEVVSGLVEAENAKLIQKEKDRQEMIRLIKKEGLSAKQAKKKLIEKKRKESGSSGSSYISGEYKPSTCLIGEATSSADGSTSRNVENSSGWSYIARFKDPKKSNMAAKCIKDAVNNQNIKYDPERFQELWIEAEKYNFDVSKVNKKVHTVCCPLVSVCARYAGVKGISERAKTFECNGVLRDMVDSIENTGEFDLIPWNKVGSCSKLKQGDILIKAAHEAMAY